MLWLNPWHTEGTNSYMMDEWKNGWMKGVFIQFLKESFASQIDLFQNPGGELQIQQKLLSTPLHQNQAQ